MKRLLFALVLFCFASLAMAYAPETYQDATEEARFHTLTTSLRCVMCQNESLADSQAPIAHDLRREILELMRRGKSDAQIRDFLVARYGEFVLYQPRVEPATWLLWFGPLLLFVAGAATVAWTVHRRAMRAGFAIVAQSTNTEVSANASSQIESNKVESSEDW
jgi:cytochrome c-type biogenesis protein CcmH